MARGRRQAGQARGGQGNADPQGIGKNVHRVKEQGQGTSQPGSNQLEGNQ